VGRRGGGILWRCIYLRRVVSGGDGGENTDGAKKMGC